MRYVDDQIQADAMGGYVNPANYAESTTDTLFYLPTADGHDLVRLYNGSAWRLYRIDYSSPPSVTNSGLSADTWYLAYLKWNSTTQQVDLLINANAAGFFEGVAVDSLDNQKRWVALIHTNGSTLFENTRQNRLILNNYNRVSMPVEATVNTGKPPVATDNITVVNGAASAQQFHMDLQFSAKIVTDPSSVTALTATLNSGDQNPKAYGPVLTSNSYGLSISYASQVNTTFSGLETYSVTFSGGNGCDLTEGTFFGTVEG
jgi:hypothetical protein